MKTWIVGKDLMKHHSLIKKSFIVVLTWKTSQVFIIGMQIEYIKNLK